MAVARLATSGICQFFLSNREEILFRRVVVISSSANARVARRRKLPGSDVVENPNVSLDPTGRHPHRIWLSDYQ